MIRIKRACQIIALALFISLVPSIAIAATDIHRIEGSNRYQTMQSIIESSSFASSWAVIATGENYPDALAASALAGAYDCPIIITEKNSLTLEARDELLKLHVSDAFIMGGSGAVSDGVEQEIAALGVHASRVDGTDRVDTSLKTLELIQKAGRSSDTIIITTGAAYADALSISPYAYATASPIVLVDKRGVLTAEAVKRIQDSDPRRIVIVGGLSAVSDSILLQLGAGYEYVRLAGSNRYETSRDVATWETEPRQGFSWQSPAVTTGKNFPDALAGSPLCGQLKSPILLANTAMDPTIDLLLDNNYAESRCLILGGSQSFDVPLEDLFAVDDITDSIIANVTGSGSQALYNAYEYVATYNYYSGNTYPQGDWLNWSLAYAQEMYHNGGGNCYRYASLLCWIARALGYDAVTVSGLVPWTGGELTAHGWVEVRLNGQTLVLDSDLHKFVQRDFFLVSYADAPIQYYHLDGTPY